MTSAGFLVELMNELLRLARVTRECTLTREEIARGLETLASQCMARSAEPTRRDEPSTL